MSNRPPFAQISSYQEFAKYYWYREELQQICRSLGIASSGMKTELCRNIEEYFKGNIIPEKKPAKSVKQTDFQPDLNSKLLECGFSFGPKFREFFAQKTGVKNFKYNADMVATVKKVRETNDLTFTLGDLLDIYYGKKTYAKYDNSALQWNRFVKDFCADPATNRFTDKLKTAAALWRIVRESTMEKKYSRELLENIQLNS